MKIVLDRFTESCENACVNEGVQVAKAVETKTISVKGIPEDLWRLIRSEAVKNGFKMGDYITVILRDHFSKLRKTA